MRLRSLLRLLLKLVLFFCFLLFFTWNFFNFVLRSFGANPLCTVMYAFILGERFGHDIVYWFSSLSSIFDGVQVLL